LRRPAEAPYALIVTARIAPPFRRRRLWPVAVALLAAPWAEGCAGDGSGGVLLSPITDGTVDAGHPAVGYVRLDGGGIGCSGTLVGRKTVLVAAHCIWPDHAQVFVLEGSEYASASSVLHPSYDLQTHLNDIGVLLLERTVHGVPTAVARQARAAGSTITLVGFGATSEAGGDEGVKRQAKNTLSALYTTSFNFKGSGGGVGNVCHKDSGGPVYAGTVEPAIQIGVTIGGQSPCGTEGTATRVDPYLAWLRSASPSDLAVEKEKGGFGFPCASTADCQSGTCADDPQSGVRYCSPSCGPGLDACPEGARCGGDGSAASTCLLPDAPEAEGGGCSLAGARRAPARPLGAGPLLLLIALSIALGRRRCPR
jgi:hypothetical protein